MVSTLSSIDGVERSITAQVWMSDYRTGMEHQLETNYGTT